MFRQSLT